jgi:hypothetical protein
MTWPDLDQHGPGDDLLCSRPRSPIISTAVIPVAVARNTPGLYPYKSIATTQRSQRA